jgi:putative hydrolase of the HAD superfamily
LRIAAVSILWATGSLAGEARLPYEAVVFDFYGTLTQAIRRGAAHDAMARALGCDPPALRALLDLTFRARARGELGAGVLMLDELARRLGRRPTREQLERAERLRLFAVRTSIRLRPDAVRTLSGVRQRGLRTGLVSDCTDDLPPIVAELPVGPLLDAAVYSCDLGAVKPDPRLFLAAARRLAVAPAECLYVGDGGGRELSAARAVGMVAVRLTEPDLAGHLVFEAERGWTGLTVRTLSDVLALL